MGTLGTVLDPVPGSVFAHPHRVFLLLYPRLLYSHTGDGMPLIPGETAVFDSTANGYAGHNGSANVAKRHVSMKSSTGVNDGDVLLLLEDVGWATKVLIWPRAGAIKVEVSMTGLAGDWPSVGFYLRKANDDVSERYPLVSPTSITPGVLAFLDEPHAPFIRLLQVGATPARADVFLQG